MKDICFRSLLIPFMMWLCLSGSQSCKKRVEIQAERALETVVRKRDDGSISSVNQVDDMGNVHGLRTTYYADGKTVYSRLTFSHGIKQGPSIWYYKNGRVFKHASFNNGKLHGPTRKYHPNGKLLSECEYENGNALAGLREYNKDGSLVAGYPEVGFREINRLSSKNFIDLEMFCTENSRAIKFYRLEPDQPGTNKIYLITEKGMASLRFYVKPGDVLKERIEILSETYTDFGNILAREHSYHLIAERNILNN